MTFPRHPADDGRAAATVATYDRIAQEYAQRSDDEGSSGEFLAWRDDLLDSDGPLAAKAARSRPGPPSKITARKDTTY